MDTITVIGICVSTMLVMSILSGICGVVLNALWDYSESRKNKLEEQEAIDKAEERLNRARIKYYFNWPRTKKRDFTNPYK